MNLRNYLVGHRGAMAIAPENTLASFKVCKQYGVDWIETDVNLLGDGTPVIFHDDSMQRIVGVDRKLSEMSFSDLDEIDVGIGFHEQFERERIPTLESLLDFLIKNEMKLNLEIKKHDHYSDDLIVSRVLSALHRVNFDYEDLLISSFDRNVLVLLKKCDFKGQLALLVEQPSESDLKFMVEYGLNWINVEFSQISKALVVKSELSNYKIAAYTVNDAKEASRLIDLGVSKIITDYPDLL